MLARKFFPNHLKTRIQKEQFNEILDRSEKIEG